MKKGPQRERFCRRGRLDIKMAETLKGVKIDEFKTVLSSGKNVLIGVLHQMERTLKETEV